MSSAHGEDPSKRVEAPRNLSKQEPRRTVVHTHNPEVTERFVWLKAAKSESIELTHKERAQYKNQRPDWRHKRCNTFAQGRSTIDQNASVDRRAHQRPTLKAAIRRRQHYQTTQGNVRPAAARMRKITWQRRGRKCKELGQGGRETFRAAVLVGNDPTG